MLALKVFGGSMANRWRKNLSPDIKAAVVINEACDETVRMIVRKAWKNKLVASRQDTDKSRETYTSQQQISKRHNHNKI